MPARIPFTKEGYENIRKEKNILLLKRPGILEELKKAREMGDLKENGAYRGARMSLSSLDGRMRHLDHLLRYGFVVGKTGNEKVGIGSVVSVENGAEKKFYTLVGIFEADPAHGKVSFESPIGKALFGKKAGDIATLESPQGQSLLRILEIS
ncbi:MAG TPA: transcription elongation factor GreA [Patescibacteria group bacterium]|nr:transcription elongation factor GreA [Patescibacteria group bacterium]